MMPLLLTNPENCDNGAMNIFPANGAKQVLFFVSNDINQLRSKIVHQQHGLLHAKDVVSEIHICKPM